jgi:hypothetical protein
MRAGLLALLLATSPLAAQTHVLVVCGLGGEPRYQEAFLATGLAVASAAETRLGVAREHVLLLTEDPTRNPRIAGRSTKAEIDTALASLAREAAPGSLVLIVLIGHGSATGNAARINLPGPDLSAAEFGSLLVPFEAQQVVVVNAASASGDWVKSLAGPRRVILTATRSGVERDETLFGGEFAAALGSEEADRDKDGRLSVLEAFDFARRAVARAYERDQRLRTEHALLEADGDGVGVMEPVATAGDGAAAAAVFLDAGASRAVAPALAGLAAERDSIEREVVRLRGRKAQMTASEYDRALEALLLELARVARELKQREGGIP